MRINRKRVEEIRRRVGPKRLAELRRSFEASSKRIRQAELQSAEARAKSHAAWAEYWKSEYELEHLRRLRRENQLRHPWRAWLARVRDWFCDALR